MLSCRGCIRNLVFVIALLAVVPAWAATTPSQFRLTYAVYASGFHVVDATLDLNLKKSTYLTELSASTDGFLGRLVPWRGVYTSKGSRKGDTLTVAEHKSISTWKGSDDVTTFTYDGKGNLKSLKKLEDGEDKSPKDIDRQLSDASTDILTATLMMLLKADKDQSCAQSTEIFDGRRRFGLDYKDLGSETLLKSRYNMYMGPALKCTVEVTPNGGAWGKKPRGWFSIQEQGRKKGALPTMWLADVAPALPTVPVRVMVKTDYGTLFVHLVAVTPVR